MSSPTITFLWHFTNGERDNYIVEYLLLNQTGICQNKTLKNILHNLQILCELFVVISLSLSLSGLFFWGVIFLLVQPLDFKQ